MSGRWALQSYVEVKRRTAPRGCEARGGRSHAAGKVPREKETESEERAAKTAELEGKLAEATAEIAALRVEIRKKEARACPTPWWS